VTERVYVNPPGSQIGPISPQQRQQLMATSLVAGAYEKTVDRESAYEKLKGRAATTADAAAEIQAKGGTATAPAAGDQGGSGGWMGGLGSVLFGSTGPRGGQHDGLAQTMAKSVVRQVGSSVGREIVRGVLGGLLGGSGGRRR
jgi:hypothetical protein